MSKKHIWQIGTIVGLESLFQDRLIQLKQMGMDTYQLALNKAYEYDDDMIKKIKDKMGDFIPRTSIVHPSDNSIWNFYGGPLTIGLRPAKDRDERINNYKKAFDVVSKLNIPMVTSHLGFIPEDPNLDDYKGMAKGIKTIAQYAGERNIILCLETGQETPITLVRTIEDAGIDNLGINLDPANLLMYGKANPVDALDIFGKYVRSLHVKDGEYPTNAKELGVEKPLNQGRANFPALLKKLYKLNFDGPLIIEREIHGEKQIADVQMAFDLLEKWMQEIEG